VIVCGDLVHAFPAVFGIKSHTLRGLSGPFVDLSVLQVADFKKTISKIDPEIPLVCLCGNHDVGNSPTRASIDVWKSRFGDDYFTFWVGGVCNVVVNANLFSDPSSAWEDYKEHLKWLEHTLKENAFKGPGANAVDGSPAHLLMFQHQSWFLEHHDEEDGYFTIPRERRDHVMDLLQEAKVRAVFAGHYHRNAYGRHGTMEMVTTSAVGMQLGTDSSGFRMVKVWEHDIEHQYYGLDDMPTAIDLTKLG